MADWFKFYNDGLDAAEFQWCLSEQPLVTSVWIAILSEASKKRRASFKWKDDDFELLGMARKVNVSPPIFNQCLGLLQKVGYIVKDNGYITIPGWESRQSDYARGLDRGYYKRDSADTSRKSVETSNILASVSQVSTVRGEERIGEENRVEEKEDSRRLSTDVNNRSDSSTLSTLSTHTAPAPEAQSEKKKKVAVAPVVVPASLQTPEFLKAWADWQEHLRQKKKPPTALALTRQLDKLEAMGPSRAIAAIDNSIAHNWQGIFEEVAVSQPQRQVRTVPMHESSRVIDLINSIKIP